MIITIILRVVLIILYAAIDFCLNFQVKKMSLSRLVLGGHILDSIFGPELQTA